MVVDATPPHEPVAFDSSGAKLWSASVGDACYTHPAIGDLEGDGSVEEEVVLDGTMEILIEDRVYAVDGRWLWSCGCGGWGSFPQPINVDTDPEGERLMAGTGKLVLCDDDGSVLWERAPRRCRAGPIVGASGRRSQDRLEAMTAIARNAAERLDHARALLLRLVVRGPLLQAIFRDRPRRLAVLYLCFCAVALTFASTFPLWQLALGPAVFGVAHLASSLRYFHHGLATPEQRGDPMLRSRAFTSLVGIAILFGVWGALRSRTIMGDAVVSEWERSDLVAPLLTLATLGLAAWLYKKPPRTWLLGLLLISPLAVGMALNGPVTIGILVLVHNLVGFFTWTALARTQRERRVALAAMGLFLALSFAILGGALDPLFGAVGSTTPLRWAGLKLAHTGHLVFPGAEGPWLLRATAAYSFGQSMHYFVWLKAIPDSAHDHPVSPSFRVGLRLLEGDFGRRAAQLVLILVVAGALGLTLVQFRTARAIYFVVAGFHGYIEIAALGLLVWSGRGPARRTGRLSPRTVEILS